MNMPISLETHRCLLNVTQWGPVNVSNALRFRRVPSIGWRSVSRSNSGTSNYLSKDIRLQGLLPHESPPRRRKDLYNPEYMTGEDPDWAQFRRIPLPYWKTDISVHENHVVQLSLCVCREPLIYVESDYERRWRQFREGWGVKTSNPPARGPDCAFTFRFLKNASDEYVKKSTLQQLLDNESLTETDDFFNETDGDLDDILSKEDDNDASSTVEHAPTPTKGACKDASVTRQSVIADKRNQLRRPEETVYFLVKYEPPPEDSVASNIARTLLPNTWAFPTANQVPGFSMRQVLAHICHSQISPEFLPYFVGLCPFAVAKRAFREPQYGLAGKKRFFFKAHHWLDERFDELQLPPKREGFPAITDYGWFTKDELFSRLPEGDILAVGPGLAL